MSVYSAMPLDSTRTFLQTGQDQGVKQVDESVEKTKKLIRKISPVEDAESSASRLASTSSSSSSFYEKYESKKRKIGKCLETSDPLTSGARFDPSMDGRKVRGYYPRGFYGERRHVVPFHKPLKMDLKPTSHRGDGMQSLEKPKHSLTVQNRKEAPYIEMIREGKKKAECRVNYPQFRRIQVGDTIQFHNRHVGILCRVTYLHVYPGFKEMVIGEKVQNILPHIYNEKLSSEELINHAVRVYEKFPNSNKVKEFGAVAIGVIYLRDYFKGH